jgi:hypothetical protein
VPQHQIAVDKKMKMNKTKERRNADPVEWTKIFDADAFNKEHKPLLVTNYAMDENAIKDFGATATKIMKVLTERANKLEEDEDRDPRYQSQISARPPKKLYRNYSKLANTSDYEIQSRHQNENQYRSKKKMRRMVDLNTREKISIVHKVLVGLMS